MEFWGAEVKVGETIKIDPYDLEAAAIHISQVALGEAKKDKPNESVVIYLKVGEQKLVLGTLTKDKIPQISLDIVLEKEFELSHNSKAASVHFCGYKAYYEDNDDSEEEGETDSEDEDIPLITTEQNGKPEPKAEELKVSESKKADAKNAAPAKNAANAKHVKVVDPKDDDSDDDDESDDEIGSSDDEMENADSDSDSEDEDDSDEDDEEETPVKKVDQGKKRPNESASKTPVSTKKSKNSTPEKTDGKKAVHTATPHPKKGGKTPNSDAKTPKSGGLSCSSCSKTFNSETGLTQHSKAKHGAK